MSSVIADNFSFSSSVKDDIWHPQKDDKSYEWWYFDALSDDGSEAVVIVFLDNFIYSPRYNQESTRITGAERCPAVSFTYFRDGKAIYKATTEFHSSDFRASEERPEVQIGESGFVMDAARYGSGYMVTVKAGLPGARTLEAKFEWLSVESDLSAEGFSDPESRHCWNMVAPRSDVTGRIEVSSSYDGQFETIHFRGTGYHDHNLDNRWLAKTVRDWHWGRAHFAECSVVFCRFREVGSQEPRTRLLLIRDGVLEDREVEMHEQEYVRDKFGIRYPSELEMTSSDGIRLHVKPVAIIDSSFYFLRFLSEITLGVPGKPDHSTSAITEFIAPKTLKYRWLNWLADVRTGKNGESSYF
jgi:carotenoid 1,2-hydratase